MREMNMINNVFIGYYNTNVLLCASTDKALVKGYMKEIRGLSKNEYDILTCVLDEGTMFDLYEDYVLQEFSDGLFITTRDIEALHNELRSNLRHIEETYHSMKDFYYTIKNIKALSGHAKDLKHTIENMQDDLTSQKVLKKIQKELIHTSTILTPDIGEYLRQMGYILEDKEMQNLFLNRLYDEKS